MKKNAAWVLLACLLLSVCSFGAAEEGPYTKYRKNFFGTFDTIVTLMGYTGDQETFDRVADEVQRQFEHYHQIFDTYNAYDGVTNLYILNRDGAKEPVRVEPELIDLLLYCRARQPQTNGMFNAAMGSLLSIWHDYREAGSDDPENAELPPMDKLRSAADHMDFDNVVIDEEAGTVFLADPALRLDVGAVAKGYAAERVGQWLLESEMPSFLLSAGGNVRVGNPPLDGRLFWGVSIQDPGGNPFSEPGADQLDVLFVANTSVVTSGDYQRFYVVDGKRYHHIISPETLMPSDHFRSVTVVCEDSGWADILSTTLFLMPYEAGLAYVETLDGVEAFWMLADDSIHMTDGMLKMSRDFGGATSR